MGFNIKAFNPLKSFNLSKTDLKVGNLLIFKILSNLILLVLSDSI